MAKSTHKRKKTKRVRHWAIWIETRDDYYLACDGTVILYKTRELAEAMVRRSFYMDNEPCRVERVELRKI